MSPSGREYTVWSLWGLTTLLTAGLAATSRLVIRRGKSYFEQLDLKEMPLLTELTIAWGGVVLWVLVILVAVGVAYGIARKGPETGQIWVSVQALLFLGIAILVILAMVYPFVLVQVQLTPRGK